MSDCGICIGGQDFDGMIENLDMHLIRARKPHKCYECRRDIQAGSECERGSGLWEGKFDAWHTCMDCYHIRVGLTCDGPSALGVLWEDIYEAFAYSPFTSACLDKVETASAKAYLQERWMKWKGLRTAPVPFAERPQAPEAQADGRVVNAANPTSDKESE